METSVKQLTTVRCETAIDRSLRKLMTPSPLFELTFQGQQDRQPLESYIARQFMDVHGARVNSFLPALLSIRYQDGFRGALGIKPASTDPLFLEHYLDIPAEQAIAAIARVPVDRRGIVEIGNLVSTLPGATVLLYLVLLALVHKAGYQYVMFTAIADVRHAIEKLGFVIAPICEADPEKLQGSRQQWGRYYDNHPEVMVGFVNESISACANHKLMDAILCVHEHINSRFARQLRKTV